MKTTMFLAAAAISGSTALAAPLGPNTSVSFPVNLGGPVAALPIATLSTPFTYSGIGTPFSGILNSYVYNSDPLNVGGLTFVYTVTNTSANTEAFGAMTVNGFGGWAIDGSTDATAPAPLPFDIYRSISGGEVTSYYATTGIPFHGVVMPGMTSGPTILRTNATAWTLNIGAVINGSVAGNIDILAPVPTPGSAALLGLGTLAAFRRRR
ncbi:MAG TPA: hypothetical protein VEB22_10620 [Phycisphaerales bacterium]|nr:hypothetical protein [Phycisphaerales bacterium]